MKMFSLMKVIVIGMLLALIAVVMFRSSIDPPQTAPALSPRNITSESNATPPPRVSDMLAERIEMLSNIQPTPEELQEKREYNRRQALAFSGGLNDPDPGKRTETVEQLGAYPSPEAEDFLVQALTQDTDAHVRTIAARTLDTLEEPSSSAIDALLQGIEDQAPEVQQASLLTLENYLTNQSGKILRVRIVQGLKKKARTRNLNEETNEYLQDLLLRNQNQTD